MWALAGRLTKDGRSAHCWDPARPFRVAGNLNVGAS
jgi:hypothetical protein